MLVKKTASCADMLEWFEQNHQIVDFPLPGDIVFFKFKTNKRRTNHIGLIVHVNSAADFNTDEGNTSINSDDNGGKVMQRHRTNKNVVAFARPKYRNKEEINRLIAIANGELGISEYPPNSNNVKYNTWFYKHTVQGKNYPWCCVFISWLFHQLDGGTTISKPTLKMGSKGAEVKELQIIMNKLGYTLSPDGEFGPLTQASVKNFQRAKGLTPDGIVGPKTWEKLLCTQ